MRLVAIIMLGLLTAACGFQLRGQSKLPFATLYVDMPANSSLGIELKRNLVAGTSTRVVDSAANAQAIFSAIAEQRGKRILSFDASGRVAELQLGYSLKFRVRDAKGRDYLPQTEIRLTRDISYSGTQVLAKESEEALLYRDMQTDMVQHILRRLAAAPAQPISFEPKDNGAAAR